MLCPSMCILPELLSSVYKRRTSRSERHSDLVKAILLMCGKVRALTGACLSSDCVPSSVAAHPSSVP